MRALFRTSLTALALVSATALGMGAAEAKCKKMGFLVNDYGKDGPTNDAKNLLDKEIAKWAAENGIANYKVSKKDVSCELYIDLILFDEHTCTASATVCWDEPGGAPAKSASGEKKKSSGKPGESSKAAATPQAAESKKADAEPKADSATEQAKSEENAAPAAPAPIETGTLPGAPDEAAATQPAAAVGETDAAARAAAAAERAAEAAERAAAAAERAAKAASQPAAANAPSQLEMPSFGASGAAAPASVDPVKPVNP